MLLQSIDFRRNAQHPAVFLDTTPRLEYDCPPMHSQLRHLLQGLSGLAAFPFNGPEQVLAQRLPDNECDGGVLVGAGVDIGGEICPREGAVARVITVEGLVGV